MRFLILLFALAIVSCKTADLPLKNDESIIISVLKAQEQAWNNADLDAFMLGYQKSDSLKFIGSKGVTYGWENVLSNYKKHYSSKEKMGMLTFEVIHLDALSSKSYRMIGSYRLDFENSMDAQKGFFTLIWEKINGKWLISSDHTS